MKKRMFHKGMAAVLAVSLTTGGALPFMAQTVHAEDTAAEQGQTPEKKSGTVTLEKKNDGTYVFGNEYLKRTFSLSADKVLSTKEITNYRTGTPTVFTPQAGSEEFIINTLDNNSEGEDSGFVAPKKKLETTGWKATADSVAENEAPNGGADKMFDGDNNTYYHSKYGDGVDAAVKEYPHNIYVDFGSQKSFQSLRYQQRVDQNGTPTVSGHVKGYKIYTGDSIDALKTTDGAKLVGQGSFENKKETYVNLDEKVTAQYVRIEFVDCYEPSAANVSKDVACCSEFDFFEDTATFPVVDNATQLKTSEMKVQGEPQLTEKDGVKTLTFTFEPKRVRGVDYTIKEVITMKDGDSFMRKHLDISVGEGQAEKAKIDYIDLENMNIAQTDLKQNEYWTISDTMADNPDMGGMKGDYLELGQPYYVGAMYWGCEFPETENKIKGSNSFIRYYYGKSLKSDDKFEYNEGNENGKMKHTLKSAVTTTGRRMAGARSLWRANGMREEQFGRPVIGIANSFTQLVPGHVHLHEIGQYVKQRIEALGCFAAEFNTIAVDDGIAMGHDGMLYSLPSREIIADSVEYMASAHKIDALVCISNCDKITPGMLMAAMRLNIPTVFVSGGPMEAGKFQGRSVDLIDAMVMGADETCSDAQIAEIERCACPGCGSCSGMFTANSMNCLTEALGLSLPGNGTIVATHVNRRRLFEDAAALIVRNAERYYFEGDERVLPRSIATKAAFENAMSLDIAMGGSTNTVLHLLAVAHEAGVDFTMQDIDRLSRRVPVLCKVAPNSHYHIQDVNRAGGIFAILGELDRAGLLDTSVLRVDGRTLGEAIPACDILNPAAADAARRRALSAPAGHYSRELGAQHSYYEEPDTDRTAGCIRDVEHAYFRDGGLAVLTGNIARQGCVVKTAGVDEKLFVFRGPARVYESQEQAMNGILADEVQPGEVVVIRYEGPKGGPGMQEMLYPTSYLKSKHLDKACALITDGRFSGGTSGLSIGHVSPEAASGGEIAVVRTGDEIEIDIPGRSIRLAVDDAEIAARMAAQERFRPAGRDRRVPASLRAYARLVSSADKGAVRIVDDNEE